MLTVETVNTLKYTSCPMCDSKHIESHMEVKDHSISKEKFELWKCNDCSFVFTQNPPVEAQCAPYYESEDYISHSDKKEGLRDQLYHLARKFMLGRKASILERHLGKNSKSILLDVGSGTGYFLNHMKAKNWQVQGIEVSEKARDYCKQNFNIIANPPERLFQLEEKFDAITLWHVLEHLYDFHKYIAQFKALLKQDGILVIAVPNHSSKDAKHYHSDWAAYDVPRHLWHFTPKNIEFIAEKHDLKLSAKYAMPLDAFYVSMLSEQYRKGTPIFNGIINGIGSNLKAWNKPEQSSSVIYILEK